MIFLSSVNIMENLGFGLAFSSRDRIEGINAFLKTEQLLLRVFNPRGYL